METPAAIYGWDNPFSKASANAVFAGENNARGLEGLDMSVRSKLNLADGADRNHGICCGIAAAWVVAVCNGVDAATSTFQFKTEFFQVLRFQGSYVKAVQGDWEGSTGKHLAAMFSFGDSGAPVKLVREESMSNVSKLKQPNQPWAAYIKLPKHAVACGAANSKYYIMDPNRGLYEYVNEFSWKLDLNELIHKRNVHKNRAADRNVTFWLYKAA